MSRRPALVFDLDGTLIDSAPDIHAAANLVFEARGLGAFDFETVKGCIGNGVGVLVSRLLAVRGLPETGPFQAGLVDAFVKIYKESHDLTSLYPGVTMAVEALHAAGFRLGICTNKPVAAARSVLRHFRLDSHFTALVGGDSLPVRKPDPAPLAAAISALGGGPALFVGDSEVDAQTARAAGVALALHTRGYCKAPVESLGARLVFDDFAALPRLVAHLSARL